MSQLSGSWSDLPFNLPYGGAAFNTSTSEGSLLTTPTVFDNTATTLAPVLTFDQPTIPAAFIKEKMSFRILARGILGTTGTPTLTFRVRLGTTNGSTYLSGSLLGVTAAITCGNGVSNQFWEMNFDLECIRTGTGTNQTRFLSTGHVMSGGGFAAPYIYSLIPDQSNINNWATLLVDRALSQYVNITAQWSANSSSNTITMKQLKWWCDN